VPRRLRYTEKALDDLDAARRWLTQPGSGPAARRKLAAIRADIRRLQQDPCLWPAGDLPGVRELPAAGGWRVLYEVAPDTGRSATAGDVRVLRVYGPGQDRRGLRPPP
jgi:plasmid stabilization system protein ParE